MGHFFGGFAFYSLFAMKLFRVEIMYFLGIIRFRFLSNILQ